MRRDVVGAPRGRLLLLAAALCLTALGFDIWAHRQVHAATSALDLAQRERARAAARRDASNQDYQRDLARASAMEKEANGLHDQVAAMAWFKDGVEAGQAFVKAHPEAQRWINEAWTNLANGWPRALARAAGFSEQQTEASVRLFQRQRGKIPYIYAGIRLKAENGGDLGIEAQTTMLENLVGHDLYEKYERTSHDRSGDGAAAVYIETVEAGDPLTFDQLKALKELLATGKGDFFSPEYWDPAGKSAAKLLSPSQLKAFNVIKEAHTR
jgi:hypothetical protein